LVTFSDGTIFLISFFFSADAGFFSADAGFFSADAGFFSADADFFSADAGFFSIGFLSAVSCFSNSTDTIL